MNPDSARLYISIKEGVFEASGPEAFVTNQIKAFEEDVRTLLKGLHGEAKATAKVHVSATEELKKQPEKRASTGDVEDISDIFEFFGEEIKISIKVPGNTTAGKVKNAALLYLYAKRRQTGSAKEVPTAEIRKVCEENGILDTKNFAATLKDAKPAIVITGAKGAQKATLTPTGITEAEKLVVSLHGNGS